MLEILTPPGIGDTSWIISKIWHAVGKRKIGVRIFGSPPYRAEPLLQLLPEISNMGYWNAPIHQSEWPLQPIDAVPMELPDQRIFMTVNDFLEKGIPLHQCWPAMATEYHYPLHIAPPYQRQAEDVFRPIGRPALGVYASGYACASPWELPGWKRFLDGLRQIFPAAAYFMIGAEYDNRTRELGDYLRDAGAEVHDLVGQLYLAATLAVMQKLDYFFAHPSGLGILADVIDVPCLMWYYGRREFCGTYADPKNVESSRHINLDGNFSPEASLEVFRGRGLKWISPVN